MTTPPAHEHGSIVIEAMVAALILAAMAGLLFQTMTSNAAASRALAERRRALLVAQSELAIASAQGILIPSVREGQQDGLLWRVSAAPYPLDGGSDVGAIGQVIVTVREPGGGGPLVSLRSLRVGR